ncbi:MAG: hypothetical protein ACREX3_01515 [Gammaproteobacteria bacterium]
MGLGGMTDVVPLPGGGDCRSVITPSGFLEYALGLRGMEATDLTVPERVIFTTSPGIAAEAARLLDGEVMPNWVYHGRYPLFRCRLRTGDIAVAHVRVGGPGAVLQLDELGAAGGRAFIGVGTVGSLDDDLDIGDVVVVESAVASDGVSRYYSAEPRVEADGVLLSAVQRVLPQSGTKSVTASVASTDAPYRECTDWLQALRAKGMTGVDMETAGVYSMARFRGYAVVSLLAVNNHIGDDIWRPAFDSPRLEKGIRSAIDVAAAALAGP